MKNQLLPLPADERPAMRLPHYRLRTLMIAVAVAALGLWGASLTPRVRAHREKAAQFAVQASQHIEEIASTKQAIARSALRASELEEAARAAGSGEARAEHRDIAAMWRERVAGLRENACWRERSVLYYNAMRLKYERAAWLPFLPVAPDPPAPE